MLRVNEIFESISGEAGFFPQGSWCTFIRLQGCNLSCVWCDTQKAQIYFEGQKMTSEEIAAECKVNRILITGGEPLMQQDDLQALVKYLKKENPRRSIQIETNGSYSIPTWKGVSWVVDYKCSSSGVGDRHTAFDDGSILKTAAMVKFVISGNEDLLQSLIRMRTLLNQGYIANFLISPAGADKTLIPAIANFICFLQSDKFLINRIVFSLQLHKIIGMP